MSKKERFENHHGDNLAILQGMADNSVDSFVTDPPYGLGREPDMVKCLQDWIDHGYHEVGGKGFMGKTWDAFVPQPIFWKEVFRVLRPGGHVVSFGGTRTYDLMVLAIRLAGFEIRDQLIWAYGGGFPKSHDISKAIDKQAGAVREIGDVKRTPDGKAWTDRRPNGIPSDIFVSSIDTAKAQCFETTPSTPEAQQWDGWGTALSPSHEPIVLARKPLEKGLTIAQNVLKWGTGALNIDGCRIGTERLPEQKAGQAKIGTFERYDMVTPERTGRWPSNLLLSNVPSVIGLFPETGGGKAKHNSEVNRTAISTNSMNPIQPNGKNSMANIGDSGSASRYFFRADLLPIEEGELNLPIHVKAYYCSKPSKYERSLGVAGESKAVGDGRNIPIDNAYQRGKTERMNTHPTVKPVALMHHLVQLVTPPKGICIDPFMGSGTTGIGAMLAGPNIRFIGLEMTAEYIPIATDRITNWKRYRQFVEAKATDTPSRKAASKVDAPLTLF